MTSIRNLFETHMVSRLGLPHRLSATTLSFYADSLLRDRHQDPVSTDHMEARRRLTTRGFVYDIVTFSSGPALEDGRIPAEKALPVAVETGLSLAQAVDYLRKEDTKRGKLYDLSIDDHRYDMMVKPDQNHLCFHRHKPALRGNKALSALQNQIR